MEETWKWTEDEVVDAFNKFKNPSNSKHKNNDDFEKKLRDFLKTMDNSSFGEAEVVLAVQQFVSPRCVGQLFHGIVEELRGR